MNLTTPPNTGTDTDAPATGPRKRLLRGAPGSASLIGKRVQIEGVACGEIVDETLHTIGVLLDVDGCQVVYCRKEDLEETPGLPPNHD